jgi:RNA polymerase sigma factor (sigma-70 family)
MKRTDVNSDEELVAWVAGALAGQSEAATSLLGAIQDDIYRLSLRMLGHPQDAEDATQSILLVVLTHCGTFRGECAFRTWVWRLAANELMQMKRRVREDIRFETLNERLRSGLEIPTEAASPQALLLEREVRLRCTQAMLLCLDRDLRLAYILGEILFLPGTIAAEVLQIDAAAYRQRLGRARTKLYQFMKGWCGLYSDENRCRCSGQVTRACARGLVNPQALDFATHSFAPAEPSTPLLARAADELTELFRVGEVLRQHPAYSAPPTVGQYIRELFASKRLDLLRHPAHLKHKGTS